MAKTRISTTSNNVSKLVNKFLKWPKFRDKTTKRETRRADFVLFLKIKRAAINNNKVTKMLENKGITKPRNGKILSL